MTWQPPTIWQARRWTSTGASIPSKRGGTFGGQLPTLRGLLNEFRGCVWWGGDWQSPIDEMHFQLNYPEGKLAGGSFTVAVDQRLVDLANDLQNGYLGIWQPADPNVFPLPTGYFYGPFDGPEQCISGEYPGEPQTWRDGLGRWQETLGLPVTKKWNDNRTPQAATTLQQQKRWPPTAEVGAGTVHEGEWDAVVKEGWRLPDGWNPDTILVGGSPDTTDFPLPQDYFWGPLNGARRVHLRRVSRRAAGLAGRPWPVAGDARPAGDEEVGRRHDRAGRHRAAVRQELAADTRHRLRHHPPGVSGTPS